MLVAIDHGNKAIKHIHGNPFTTALHESDSPLFGKEVLHYKGRYYTHSEERRTYDRDKIEDDTFLVLSLFAIAAEINAAGMYTPDSIIDIQLAMGLPPAYYGSLQVKSMDYYSKRGVIDFEYQARPYHILINEVCVYPQAYSAAITAFNTVSQFPMALIFDIGGFTADYMVMYNGQPDFKKSGSLENGVIMLYNNIRSKLNADYGMVMEERQIDAILTGQGNRFASVVNNIVTSQTQAFVNDLLSQLRERGIDMRTMDTVFVGGGSILLKRFIESSGKTGHNVFIDDVKANARGYEILYRIDKDPQG